MEKPIKFFAGSNTKYLASQIAKS
ncbi:MAG: hypothetical protein ACKVJA_01805, partial [Flavobacteriales bacterium]